MLGSQVSLTIYGRALQAYRRSILSEEQKNQSNHPETPDEPGAMSRLRQRLVNAWMRPLPLQDETATFILVNVLDIFVTYLLLSIGGTEANPIARFFLYRWGFDGND